MKLDFRFGKYIDSLMAEFPHGFYEIAMGESHRFVVDGHKDLERFTVGEYDTLYEALDAANEHYFGR